jgi:hypothetical protein
MDSSAVVTCRLRRVTAHVTGAASTSSTISSAGAPLARVEPMLFPMSRHWAREEGFNPSGYGAPAGWGSLPRRNADGLPVVALTDEQRYTFDTHGWVLFPGVLI